MELRAVLIGEMNVFAASRKQWEELLAHAPPASASPRLLFLDHGAAAVAKSSIGLFSLLESEADAPFLELSLTLTHPCRI